MFEFEKNRVTDAIAAVKKHTADRLEAGKTTAAKLKKLSGTLDMDVAEFVRFQELKSLASQNGKLTLAEAQLIYEYLGESPYTFNEQPVEVKVVLTALFSELLAAQLKEHAVATQDDGLSKR